MRIKMLFFVTFLLFIVSCKKNETTTTPQQDVYLTTSAGSTWNYHETDLSGTTPVNKDFTLTSTSRDSSINSRNYHVFSNSGGSSQYLNITGSDYYQFDSLPAGFGTSTIERLYLKDNAAVGANWNQATTVTLPGVPLAVPVTLTFSVVEKGISRTVNGMVYSNVIHVTTSISSVLIPAASLTTSINSYYAKKYGLIETTNIISLNYMGVIQNLNTETKLVNA